MSAGLLTGAMTRERVADFAQEDWRRSLPNFREPRLSRNLRLVEHLREIGKRHGRTPGEVAIAWTLNHPAVTGAIVGFRSPKQVAGIVGALEFRLTRERDGGNRESARTGSRGVSRNRFYGLAWAEIQASTWASRTSSGKGPLPMTSS